MRSPRPLLLAALAGSAVVLSACTGPTASETAPSASASPAAVSPSAAPAATTTASPEPGPVARFESWWTAVRAADTVAACGALTEPLQQRMIQEYNAATGAGIADCATLIAQTSALYAATGMSADVDVELASETATEVVLNVTYAGGDCGTVHLDRTSGSWMLTDLSREC
ncbi:hypothetical protein SAMN04487848_0582 [Microbacterium sp. ru370.1]|uniref:hypothetical protein n=1 Tax=unclassified Microbacterium TaxID=2609290 RepID=UPI0008874B75|nr:MULTISPECIES: hypothetical protein [unclassified Microbacterium]SDO36235.1 hypothetical protein SAMN04487848_0582 [Microbacterium sp. ru370.1]SIT78041.1 hypothetical protein SAMN05880579_0577 [Microbacterium sp. RU1D]